MPNRKTPLYSPSRRKAVASPPEPRAPGTAPQPATAPPDSPPAQAQPTGVRAWRRHLPALAWSSVGALLAAALMLVVLGQQPQRPPLTQKQLDAAIRHSLEKDPLPSPATKAYEGVARSVVRVVGLMDEEDDATERPEKRAMERSLGTGVVIKDDGTILTNLHVVHGAKRVRVTFADGHESDAPMVGAQPENDLAVLKAKSLPDDLMPATMRSTGDLAPGDQVIAVGHPFGIGPSVSAGVISGLGREFRSPEGQHSLTNLIQFDAAANPGNSGGPLVTMDGFVVGIVTAILNPNEQRTFVGIGFAVPIENAAGAAGLAPF
ncbi:MAG: trypsin-like peptidase domain-containing protein [Rubrivivax sp.]|nr:trypsin-like peptidase domain-containing protein [Rubrivivax sp.]